MADIRASRDHIDAAIGWLIRLEAVVGLLGDCRDLAGTKPDALSSLLRNIHDELEGHLGAAFRDLCR